MPQIGAPKPNEPEKRAENNDLGIAQRKRSAGATIFGCVWPARC